MGQFFSNLLAGFGIKDIIDIGIVSFLFYKGITYARTTRAWQLAKGLLVFVAVAAISSVLNFYILNWIIREIISVGLIALVVVFQPELRRALEYLGRNKLVNAMGYQKALKQEDIAGNVEKIVRAANYFAARKEGALMVIERRTALMDIAETGTRVDATISEDLLENIFYKGSPLHDGAALLRGDRILAAGCVLPLTQNHNLSKELGTRHRAGLGISEVSDALAVIVSEETGIISVAQDGKLSRFLDGKSLEKLLLNMYMSDAQEDESPLFKFTNLLRRKENEKESEDI